MNQGPNLFGVIVDIFQTVAIIANTAVLVYIVLRFDQAIRGASKNLSAVLKDGREFRQESRAEFDRPAVYAKLGEHFERRDSVDHSRGEYGYRDRKTNLSIDTNTVEGYYSIFKRGMKGVYQHCAENHLHRYLAEFDFRYSQRVRLGVDDVMRAGSRPEPCVREAVDLSND